MALWYSHSNGVSYLSIQTIIKLKSCNWFPFWPSPPQRKIIYQLLSPDPPDTLNHPILVIRDPWQSDTPIHVFVSRTKSQKTYIRYLSLRSSPFPPPTRRSPKTENGPISDLNSGGLNDQSPPPFGQNTRGSQRDPPDRNPQPRRPSSRDRLRTRRWSDQPYLTTPNHCPT